MASFFFSLWKHLNREHHPLLAGATIILIYAPSVACLILTFTQVPKLENIGDLLTWITIQCLQSLLFPLGIIYRYLKTKTLLLKLYIKHTGTS